MLCCECNTISFQQLSHCVLRTTILHFRPIFIYGQWLMSPFSRFFHQLRITYGIRQVDLAALMGYEQSYISALEIGIKGPPPSEFINRLIEVLALPQTQQDELQKAVAASQRKLVIPSDVPEDAYWLLEDLRHRLEYLHPAEINLIREIIRLREKITQRVPSPVLRLRRRNQEDDKM